MTDAPPPSIPPRKRPSPANQGDVRTVGGVPGQGGRADETMRVETGAAPQPSTAVPGPAEGGLPASVPPARTPRPVTRPVSGQTARPAGKRGSRTNPRTTRVTGAAAPAPEPPSVVGRVPDQAVDGAGSGTTSRAAAAAPTDATAAPATSSPAVTDRSAVIDGSTASAPATGTPRTSRTDEPPTATVTAPAATAAAIPGPSTGTTGPSTASRTRSDEDDDEESDAPSPLMEAVDRSTTWLKKTAGAAGAGVSAAYASLTRPRPQEEPMTANQTATAASARPAPVPPPHPVTGRAPAPGAPRRVRLAISRLDPWSVMKLSLLLSFALGIILVVATAVVWFTLDSLHVFASINDLVKQVVGPESAVNVTDVIGFRKVISGATLVAVIDVFLLTAMATIGAFLYNIVAALVGGVHVTMTDE